MENTPQCYNETKMPSAYRVKPFFPIPILYGFVFKPSLGRVTKSLFISICIYYSYISLSLFECTSLSLAYL